VIEQSESKKNFPNAFGKSIKNTLKRVITQNLKDQGGASGTKPR